MQELRHGGKSVEDKHVQSCAMEGGVLRTSTCKSCAMAGGVLRTSTCKRCVVACLRRVAWLHAYKGLRGCMATKGCVVACLQRVAWLHAYKGLRGCMLTKGCMVAWLQRGDGQSARVAGQNTSVIYLHLVQDI